MTGVQTCALPISDYPFEKAEEAGHWLDTEKIDEAVRTDIAYKNAERLLGLKA